MDGSIIKNMAEKSTELIFNKKENKDEVIKHEVKKLKSENKKLKEEIALLKVNMKTFKDDYWFMTNLLERFSTDKDQAIKDCIYRMNFRLPLFKDEK